MDDDGEDEDDDEEDEDDDEVSGRTGECEVNTYM